MGRNFVYAFRDAGSKMSMQGGDCKHTVNKTYSAWDDDWSKMRNKVSQHHYTLLVGEGEYDKNELVSNMIHSVNMYKEKTDQHHAYTVLVLAALATVMKDTDTVELYDKKEKSKCSCCDAIREVVNMEVKYSTGKEDNDVVDLLYDEPMTWENFMSGYGYNLYSRNTLFQWEKSPYDEDRVMTRDELCDFILLVLDMNENDTDNDKVSRFTTAFVLATVLSEFPPGDQEVIFYYG